MDGDMSDPWNWPFEAAQQFFCGMSVEYELHLSQLIEDSTRLKTEAAGLRLALFRAAMWTDGFDPSDGLSHELELRPVLAKLAQLRRYIKARSDSAAAKRTRRQIVLMGLWLRAMKRRYGEDMLGITDFMHQLLPKDKR